MKRKSSLAQGSNSSVVKKAKIIQDGDEDSEDEGILKRQQVPQVKSKSRLRSKEDVKDQEKKQVTVVKGDKKQKNKMAKEEKSSSAGAVENTEDDDLERIKKLEKEVHRSKEKLNHVVVLLEYCQVWSSFLFPLSSFLFPLSSSFLLFPPLSSSFFLFLPFSCADIFVS
jgi:hypothetical protein